MRIPDRVRTQTQSLSLNSPWAESSAGLATGRALMDAGRAVADISQTMDEFKARRTQDEIREANLLMQENMVAFEERFSGRDHISAIEVPDSVSAKRTTKQAAPDGAVVEVGRDDMPAYEVMPDMFRQYATSSLQAAADRIQDEQSRNRFIRDMELKLGEEYVRRVGKSREQQTAYIRQRIGETVDDALARRDYDLARDVAADMDDPDLLRKLNANIDRREVDDRFNDLVIDENADPEQIVSAISELRDPEADLPYTAQERVAKAAALESNLRRVTAHQMAVVERQRQKAVSDTWLLIDESHAEVDESYVDAMFEAQQIDGGTRTAMIRAIRKNREAAIEKEVVAIDLSAIAAAGYGIDPADKQLRSAVNDTFEQYIEQHEGDVWAAATQAMQEFRVVPDQIMGMFRSANRADAPNVAQAARLLMEAQDHAPASLNDFKGNDIKFLENVVANMRLGMDIQSSIGAAQSYDNLTPQQKAALDRESKVIAENNADALADLIGSHPSYDKPWSPFAPEANSFMTEEFNALVKRFMPEVGFNIPVAQRKAFDRLTRTWQMTDINGEWQLAKNMPQAPAEEVRLDIDQQMLRKLSEVSEFYGRSFKPKDVRIYSDAVTQIQINNGEKPTYASYLVVDEENGIIEQLPRFVWDAERSAQRRRDRLLREADYRRGLTEEATQRLVEKEIRL